MTGKKSHKQSPTLQNFDLYELVIVGKTKGPRYLGQTSDRKTKLKSNLLLRLAIILLSAWFIAIILTFQLYFKDKEQYILSESTHLGSSNIHTNLKKNGNSSTPNKIISKHLQQTLANQINNLRTLRMHNVYRSLPTPARDVNPIIHSEFQIPDETVVEALSQRALIKQWEHTLQYANSPISK